MKPHIPLSAHNPPIPLFASYLSDLQAWVQNVVRQFGPYLQWEFYEMDTMTGGVYKARERIHQEAILTLVWSLSLRHPYRGDP